MIIKEGESVSFAVSVTGAPTPSVEWFKDDKPISLPEDGSIKQTHVDSSHTLNFTQTKHADEGAYKALVKNIVGEVKANAKMTVQGEIG